MTNFRWVGYAFGLLFLPIAVEAGEVLRTFRGEIPGGLLGRYVSAAGDVNADGYDDVVVGAPGAPGIDPGGGTGSAQVYSGKNGMLLYVFHAGPDESQIGISVSGAGDINHDGFADVIVGGKTSAGDAYSPPDGFARIFSGKDGEQLYNLNGNGTLHYFGMSVAGAGDVNNDGYDDVIVAAPGDDSPTQIRTGVVQAFSGKTGEILYTFYGNQSLENFGGSLSGAGDVNGDGYDDIVVGAPYSDSSALQDNGSAYVFSGRDGSVIYTFNGVENYNNFGQSVSGAGDVNKDGYADVIIGAESEGGYDDIGSARVFSGVDGSLLYNFSGDHIYHYFGRSVSAAGDVNADGYADLVVSCENCARILSGKDGSILKDFLDINPENYFGVSVSGAGDVNGDGYADVIVGAFYANNKYRMWAGKAQIFNGRPKKNDPRVITIRK